MLTLIFNKIFAQSPRKTCADGAQFAVYVFMFMFPPTLSRIEMDKYLISREKSCQTPERKKESKAAVIVLPPACH